MAILALAHLDPRRAAHEQLEDGSRQLPDVKALEVREDLEQPVGHHEGVSRDQDQAVAHRSLDEDDRRLERLVLRQPVAPEAQRRVFDELERVPRAVLVAGGPSVDQLGDAQVGARRHAREDAQVHARGDERRPRHRPRCIFGHDSSEDDLAFARLDRDLLAPEHGAEVGAEQSLAVAERDERPRSALEDHAVPAASEGAEPVGDEGAECHLEAHRRARSHGLAQAHVDVRPLGHGREPSRLDLELLASRTGQALEADLARVEAVGVVAPERLVPDLGIDLAEAVRIENEGHPVEGPRARVDERDLAAPLDLARGDVELEVDPIADLRRDVLSSSLPAPEHDDARGDDEDDGEAMGTSPQRIQWDPPRARTQL